MSITLTRAQIKFYEHETERAKKNMVRYLFNDGKFANHAVIFLVFTVERKPHIKQKIQENNLISTIQLLNNAQLPKPNTYRNCVTKTFFFCGSSSSRYDPSVAISAREKCYLSSGNDVSFHKEPRREFRSTAYPAVVINRSNDRCFILEHDARLPQRQDL